MFIKVLKNAFIRWWDKMGYTFLSSLLGALNPFYLYIIYAVITWLGATDKGPLLKYAEQFILFLPAIILTAPVFPTTFAAISVQKKVIENESIYFKKYFPDFFKSLGETIKPSLLLTLMYFVSGFLVAYAGIFYYKMLPVPGLKIAVLVILFWIFLFLLLSQYVLIPLIIFNPELKLRQAIKLSFQMVIAEGFQIALIGLIDLIFNAFLILSRALGVFFYYGLSAHLRVYLHKAIVAKYAPAPQETESEHYDKIDATQSWAEVMNRFKNKDNS